MRQRIGVAQRHPGWTESVADKPQQFSAYFCVSWDPMMGSARYTVGPGFAKGWQLHGDVVKAASQPVFDGRRDPGVGAIIQADELVKRPLTVHSSSRLFGHAASRISAFLCCEAPQV